MVSKLLVPYKTLRVMETVANYGRADQIDITKNDIQESKASYDAIEL